MQDVHLNLIKKNLDIDKKNLDIDKNVDIFNISNGNYVGHICIVLHGCHIVLGGSGILN